MEITKDILKTSAEWHNDGPTGIIIIDPDGWDRTNYDYSFNQELVTFQEYVARLYRSTIMVKK